MRISVRCTLTTEETISMLHKRGEGWDLVISTLKRKLLDDAGEIERAERDGMHVFAEIVDCDGNLLWEQ